MTPHFHIASLKIPSYAYVQDMRVDKSRVHIGAKLEKYGSSIGRQGFWLAASYTYGFPNDIVHEIQWSWPHMAPAMSRRGRTEGTGLLWSSEQ